MGDAHEERFCLITGASRGLGRALAEHFWARGWSLVLVARSQVRLIEVAQSLKEIRDQAVHTLAADFADASQVEELHERVRTLVPRLDALVNNAGVQGPVGHFWENDRNAWVETIQVNLLAPVELCRSLSPWMAAGGGGSIISVSGGGATGPRPNFSAYAAAKAALVRFSESLAVELKPSNIRVNCIAPGAMSTAMLEEVVAKGEAVVGRREYESIVRTLREGGASMLRTAELCHFLASEASSGITGKLISAVWDPWTSFSEHLDELNESDVYTLRRIVPKDRGMAWGDE